jgi:hypothetical protein
MSSVFEFGMGERQSGCVQRVPGHDLHQSLNVVLPRPGPAPRAVVRHKAVLNQWVPNMRHVNAYLARSPLWGYTRI